VVIVKTRSDKSKAWKCPKVTARRHRGFPEEKMDIMEARRRTIGDDGGKNDGENSSQGA